MVANDSGTREIEHLERDRVDTGHLDNIFRGPAFRSHHFRKEFARGIPNSGKPSSR